jgi:hypothetical protein
VGGLEGGAGNEGMGGGREKAGGGLLDVGDCFCILKGPTVGVFGSVSYRRKSSSSGLPCLRPSMALLQILRTGYDSSLSAVRALLAQPMCTGSLVRLGTDVLAAAGLDSRQARGGVVTDDVRRQEHSRYLHMCRGRGGYMYGAGTTGNASDSCCRSRRTYVACLHDCTAGHWALLLSRVSGLLLADYSTAARQVVTGGLQSGRRAARDSHGSRVSGPLL